MQLTRCESSTLSLADLVKSDASVESNKSKKSVTFASVRVREYNRIIGDHPDVKVGPPISIGWEYEEKPEQCLEEFEASKPETKRYLRLSSITRKNMLLNVYGFTEEEIRSSEKEVQKIRRKREQSISQGKTGAIVESAMQSARRRLRRTFSKDSLLKGITMSAGHMMPFSISA